MLTSEQLIEGNIYTRGDLTQKFNISDATVRNGVFRPSGYQSIWLFVTEQKPKDRPQLADFLDGNILYWDGQPEGRTDKLIIEHEIHALELLVFYRGRNNEYSNYGFKYEGRFLYKSHRGSHPTHFTLQRLYSLQDSVEKDIEALQIEESDGEIYKEGKLVSRLINKHERNPALRRAAIDLHGTECQACGFSFYETYGTHGKDFVEVHHLYPVSKYSGEVSVDPSKDMAVLCANCHRMIHRKPDNPLSLDELRQIVIFHRQGDKEQTSSKTKKMKT